MRIRRLPRRRHAFSELLEPVEDHLDLLRHGPCRISFVALAQADEPSARRNAERPGLRRRTGRETGTLPPLIRRKSLVMPLHKAA